MSHKVVFIATRTVETMDEIPNLSDPQSVVDDLHGYSGSWDLSLEVADTALVDTCSGISWSGEWRDDLSYLLNNGVTYDGDTYAWTLSTDSTESTPPGGEPGWEPYTPPLHCNHKPAHYPPPNYFAAN